MTVLPPVTVGIAASEIDDHGVLFDPRSGQLVELNSTGWAVWTACVRRDVRDTVVRGMAKSSGIDPESVAAAIDTYLEQLRAEGLVGGQPRDVPALPPQTLPRIHPTSGPTYRVLDELVQVRVDIDDASGADLRDAIADLLRSMAEAGPAGFELLIHRLDDGRLRLRGPGVDQHHRTSSDLLDALPSAFNRIAESSATCLALHAAAVRSPEGRLVVLPAQSGAGKSTLTAQLVRSGWEYVTDEAVGIDLADLQVRPYAKPLSLGPTSRAAAGLAQSARPNTTLDELGGKRAHGALGAPDAIVLPAYRAGAEPASAPVGPSLAVAAVAEHALNLRIVGQPGLDALVALARQTPCHRLNHQGGSAADAMIALLVNGR